MPDYNVIIVDWSTGAASLYDRAVTNLRLVGACGGAVASAFHGADLSTVHCTGHSLGGQTCGQMGKFVQNQRESILGRISGRSFYITNQILKVFIVFNLCRVVVYLQSKVFFV